RERQLVEPEPVDGGLEPVARGPRRERDEKPRVRSHRVQSLGRAQHEVAVHVELGGAAAGKEREYRLRNAELELDARLAPRRERRRVRSERMPDESDGNPGRLVERRL